MAEPQRSYQVESRPAVEAQPERDKQGALSSRLGGRSPKLPTKKSTSSPRRAWMKGDHCDVHSGAANGWVSAQVLSVDENKRGQTVTVLYALENPRVEKGPLLVDSDHRHLIRWNETPSPPSWIKVSCNDGRAFYSRWKTPRVDGEEEAAPSKIYTRILPERVWREHQVGHAICPTQVQFEEGIMFAEDQDSQDREAELVEPEPEPGPELPAQTLQRQLQQEQAHAQELETDPQPKPLNAPGHWDVMISYTRRNPRAELLAERMWTSLTNRGEAVWLDIKMAQINDEAMKEAAQNSKCVLAVITGAYSDSTSAGSVRERVLHAVSSNPEQNAYFKRPYCLEELRWARQSGVRIQPVVRIEDQDEIGKFLAQAPADLRDLGSTDFKKMVSCSPALWETSIDELGLAPRATPQGQLRVSKDYADIPVGSRQREEFKARFTRDLVMSIIRERARNDTRGTTMAEFLFQLELEKYEDALKEEGYTLMSLYTAPADEIEELTDALGMKRPEKRTFVQGYQQLQNDVRLLQERVQITSIKEGSIIVVFEILPAATAVDTHSGDPPGNDAESTPRSRQLHQFADLPAQSFFETLEQFVSAQPSQLAAAMEGHGTAAAEPGDLMSLVIREPLQLKWVPHPGLHEGTPSETEQGNSTAAPSSLQISLTETGPVVEEDEVGRTRVTEVGMGAQDDSTGTAELGLGMRSRSNTGDASGSLAASVSV